MHDVHWLHCANVQLSLCNVRAWHASLLEHVERVLRPSTQTQEMFHGTLSSSPCTCLPIARPVTRPVKLPGISVACMTHILLLVHLVQEAPDIKRTQCPCQCSLHGQCSHDSSMLTLVLFWH